MKKEYTYVIIIAVVAFLIIGIILLTSNKSSNETNIKKLTQEEKYAMFAADLACTLSQEFGESESLEDAFAALAKTEELAEKYDFTITEIQTLGQTYDNNLNTQKLMVEYMQDMCPNLTNELQ